MADPSADLVDLALAATNRRMYWHDPVREQLPQTTRPELVQAMLRMLGTRRGERVLEIGTGSGFSTALLARIVGTDGLVVSIDVDDEMTTRAVNLLATDGLSHVVLRSGDGRDGDPDHAPFDRVVAWAQLSADVVPETWLTQCRRGGTIVAPLRRRDAPMVIRFQVSLDGQPIEDGGLAAGFTPLAATPHRPWLEDG